jgi:hypothetical protein
MSLTKSSYFITNGAPANVLDYGADPTGTTECAAAIQAAIDVGRRVYIPKGVYKIATTLRFQQSGQIIYGDGRNFGADVDQTTLKWTGASGGKMLSCRKSASGIHSSNCQLNDLCLEGNALAGVGWEVYDATGTGGNWRNCSYNVTIQNVTQGSGIALELGHTGSAPSFANDFFMMGGGLVQSKIGAYGNGSTLSFVDTTIFGNTVAGSYCEAGSQWSFTNCVLSTNKTDILCHNPQNINVSGGWCENSTDGILTTVAGSTQNTVNFNGVYLHTSNASGLMNLGSTAGAISINGCFVPGVAASNKILNINPDYGFSTLGSTNIAAGGSQSNIGSGRGNIGNTMFGNTATGQQMAIYGILIANGASVTLPWVGSNNTFCGTISVANVSYGNGNNRTTSTYSVFYFQGDNTSLQQIHTINGSGTSATFTVSASNTGFIVTNTSGGNTNIFISANGTAMA